MCGIVGILSTENVVPDIIEGLKKLEYRGYDSAGIATIHTNGMERRRAQGKLRALQEVLVENPLEGHVGIGHTRWATHGAPTLENTHPHVSKNVAVVHNGIIENYALLKKELEETGICFTTQTDTEVIPHLFSFYLEQNMSLEEAAFSTFSRLEGSFAVAILVSQYPRQLIGMSKGAPLVVGHGKNAMYLASDPYAIAHLTAEVTYLEEGDVIFLGLDGSYFYNNLRESVLRPIKYLQFSGESWSKGKYKHFMLKEIYDQPKALDATLQAYYHSVGMTLPFAPYTYEDISQLTIIGCGTAYYAGVIAQYWCEQIAAIQTTTHIASEFRYRKPILAKNSLSIFISQSGETLDTLAALHYARSKGQSILGVINVPESTIARACDSVLLTHAGHEIGVASTKAFTTQLTTLACFVLALARLREKIDKRTEMHLLKTLLSLPHATLEILYYAEEIRAIAQLIAHVPHVLYIGRGTSYGVALEGALKLKELSYIHAEAYPAGELKHGPIALVDENMIIIAIAPYDDLFEKTHSNIQEIVARGGKVIAITDKKGNETLSPLVMKTLALPCFNSFITPILYSIPMQLLAYYVAVQNGTDVDQPRNLAKCVTVE